MLHEFHPIKDRKIRFAIVGCGRISANHISSIEEHIDSCELVAVCDVDPVNLAKAVKQTGASGYGCLRDMLEHGGFDVVILASPSGLHPIQTIQCAEAGFHVVTEKPMATRWNDGLEMVKACDKAGVRLFVVKQNRCNATIRLLKQAIEDGRFGRIYNVACNVFWTRPQEYYDAAIWRGTWEFDGGAFMNQASHYVDLLDWLIGPVESVQSYTATLARHIDVEDSGVLALKWRNGALGTMNVSMLTYPVNEILVWDFLDKLPDDDKIKSASYATTSVFGFGHSIYYENVIKSLRGEEDPHTDGREGLKSLELLIAIYLSARDGKKISLPLEY